MTRRLLVLLAVGLIALAGCGGGGAGGAGGGAPAVAQTDVNPQPRDNVRDGGTLRLPMDIFPANFNYNQVDGTTSDVSNIVSELMPYWFSGTADGGLRLNTDYATSAELTSTDPQVVTYTINPKANWSDGSPITWRDFEAYWRSSNGTNPAYQTSGTTGYSDIATVARGVDDRQVVLTFSKPFAEWKTLFNPFYPAAATTSPQAFDNFCRTTLPLTAGPFALGSIDATAKTISVKRDPKWWGTPAKLDSIIYRQYDPAALPDALANNEIDYYEIGSDLNLLRRAQGTPGAVVRDAPSRQYAQVTFNGSPGSILAELPLRQAVAQGIDRAAITRRMLGQVEPTAAPDGNHLYPPHTKDYRDNADVLPYDPAKAAQALDALGWLRTGATRQRGGTPLTLRLVFGDAPTNRDIGATLQNELAQIGVTVVLQQLGVNELFPNITKGNFDLALFTWGGTASPLSSSSEIYGSPQGNVVRENYGRIGTPEIDALYTKGVAELDDAKRADVGNQIDRLLWQQVHSVVLYARPGAVAVRSTLANFGASGLADTDYIDAGFMK
ncbi:MAG TPA: ABC transporter family substrate-binding protein [Pseudonocardia sp.]|nr:ABC transporter family substrate-binding protein [Pseudonocardia sp.]